jgi:hypothetical protein
MRVLVMMQLPQGLKITFVDLLLRLLGFFGRTVRNSRLIAAYVTVVTSTSEWRGAQAVIGERAPPGDRACAGAGNAEGRPGITPRSRRLP